MGFMFGIVAQSVVGGDRLELFIRAVLLALLHATLYRMWRRYSGSFWATIAHLFVLTWAYYAFRQTSFDILYRVFYYLLPSALLVKLLTTLVSVPIRIRLRRSAATAE
jgi:cell shape-determining protein MreD